MVLRRAGAFIYTLLLFVLVHSCSQSCEPHTRRQRTWTLTCKAGVCCSSSRPSMCCSRSVSVVVFKDLRGRHPASCMPYPGGSRLCHSPQCFSFTMRHCLRGFSLSHLTQSFHAICPLAGRNPASPRLLRPSRTGSSCASCSMLTASGRGRTCCPREWKEMYSIASLDCTGVFCTNHGTLLNRSLSVGALLFVNA